VQIAGLTNVVQVSAGGAHSLALLSNGTVMAWGENNDGQLGTGSTKKDAKPKRIPGLSGVTAVSAGNLFSAALLKDGTVMTWGNNAYGQLGDGSTVNSDVPVAVPGLSGVAQISAGGNLSTNGHMVALLNNGTVEAWGQNFYGQLGDGTTTSSSTPVVVGGSDPLSNVVAVSAGGMFSEALLSNGSVSVWGFKNGTLQTKQEDVLLPISVPHVSNAVLIWAGASTGLAGESTSGGS
jgi:alpha-tubulin suppressor-like RCC1 family protein